MLFLLPKIALRRLSFANSLVSKTNLAMLSTTNTPRKSFDYCFSAPAKFILSGEHSVVYGKDALVATIDMRTRGNCHIACGGNVTKDTLVDVELVQLQKNFKILIIKTLKGPRDVISAQKYDWDTIQDFFLKYKDQIHYDFADINEASLTVDERVHFMYSLMHTLKYILALRQDYLPVLNYLPEHLQSTNLKIVIDSESPIAKGVGSSASYAVVIAASFLKFWEIVLNEYPNRPEKKLDFSDFEEFKHHSNQVAFDFEKIFHSTPSGLDNSAITYGGILMYNKAEQKRVQLDISFLEAFDIVLIDSGMEKNTKKTVDMVRNMTQDNILGPATMSLINSVGDVTKGIVSLLAEKENTSETLSSKQKKFDQLIKMNQCLLRGLNLTNAKIDAIIQICDEYSFSSKLTGGGDGGYCVCFIPKGEAHERVEYFLQTLRTQNFEPLKLKFAKTGLALESFTESAL